MSGFVLLLCFVLALSLHELGHAFAMRRYHIPLEEISVVGIGPVLFTFRLRKLFGSVPMHLRLFPIGAYVLPTENGGKQLERLPYLNRNDVYGAGIVVNIALGILLVGLGITHKFWVNQGPLAAVIPVISVALAVAILFLHRWIGAILPVCALAAAVMLTVSLFHEAHPAETFGGPVTIVRTFSEATSVHKELWFGLYLGGILSLLIAFTNLLPFYPFDGGHLADSFARLIVGERNYKLASLGIRTCLTLPGIAVIFMALRTDVLSFFH